MELEIKKLKPIRHLKKNDVVLFATEGQSIKGEYQTSTNMICIVNRIAVREKDVQVLVNGGHRFVFNDVNLTCFYLGTFGKIEKVAEIIASTYSNSTATDEEINIEIEKLNKEI